MIYKDTSQELYYVYIIECNDGSFYTGLTYDLLKRFSEHCEGVYPACYTFKRRPLILRYYETIPFSLEAAQREKQLKGWSRSKKLALMNGNLHKLSLLSECQNLSHSKFRSHH
ncbi:putative endonuclease [Lacibacter cauensis]|uniref:Putative endonuclease n=1 Tax=Lacibacter cauensis TaxID=510947 RepID=A0A562SRU6_9BACT|nr:putative endonuclease [Lacibacter cauensis]